MKIPLNRVVALAGPYVSVAAGAIAAWLIAKVNVTGIPGLDQQNLATQLAAGGTFALTAGLSWLGHSKWLTGHHIELAGEAEVNAAAITAAGATPVLDPSLDDPQPVEDPEVDAVADDELPDDAQELAAPEPPPAASESATVPDPPAS